MEEEYLNSSEPTIVPERNLAVRIVVRADASSCGDVRVHVVVRGTADGGAEIGVACGVRNPLTGEVVQCAGLLPGEVC